MTIQEHRARILQILYEERMRGFPQTLDYEDMSNRMGKPVDEVRREVAYLTEKGYLAAENRQRGTRVFCTLRITAKGIDLVEGRAADGTVHVGGDWIQITVGDNAQYLALGKDITQEHDITAGECEVAPSGPSAPTYPSLPGTTHVLSFDMLSPADFERLCLWLVEREGYVHVEHLGLAGNEQGRDVIAYKPTPQGEELWYFQCKRYRSIGTRALKDEVDKYLEFVREKPHLQPVGIVFVISCAVSAKKREKISAYCERHNLACEFWALTELDMRVKRYPDLLREFFNILVD